MPEDYKNILKSKLDNDYNFLRTNEHLGNNIILLVLSGSRAYGTNLPDSDLDIRGVAVNNPNETIGLTRDFEQVAETNTDTVIYSLRKSVELLINCNPNTIELLGTKPEHILYSNKYGKMLLDNKSAFLSTRASHSFGGYATAQYSRLQHGLLSNGSLEDKRLQMMKVALQHSLDAFVEEHKQLGLSVKFNEIINSDDEKELGVTFSGENVPITDFKTSLNLIQNIKNDYTKVHKEFSKKKIEGRLSKHMMHLYRLYLMGIDINERALIKTYRDEEHDLLMQIRNGEFLTEDKKNVKDEFYDLLNQVQKRFDYSVKNTILPEQPDKNRIEQMVIEINKDIILKGC